MEWQDILAAVALVFVFEGIMPFMSPRQFRKTLLTASQMTDSVLRMIGFISMCAGVLLLYVVR